MHSPLRIAASVGPTWCRSGVVMIATSACFGASAASATRQSSHTCVLVETLSRQECHLPST